MTVGNCELGIRKHQAKRALNEAGDSVSLVAHPGPYCASSLVSLIFFALPLTKDLTKRGKGKL